MKRKYAAMMLGLALSVTSINVFAEETEAVQTEATDAEDTVESTAVWGEVTAAEEGSITINIAELQGAEKTPDASDDMAAEDAEATGAEDTDAGAGDTTENADIATSGAESYAEIFTYSGEEQTLTLTEETVVQLIYQDADAEKLQELAEEYSDKEEGTEAADAGESSADDEPVVAELSIDAILEGDMIYATVDEEGNAVTVLVFVPETSTETDASEDDALTENTDSETAADDTGADDTTAE